jgi:hypothetical protein
VSAIFRQVSVPQLTGRRITPRRAEAFALTIAGCLLGAAVLPQIVDRPPTATAPTASLELLSEAHTLIRTGILREAPGTADKAVRAGARAAEDIGVREREESVALGQALVLANRYRGRDTSPQQAREATTQEFLAAATSLPALAPAASTITVAPDPSEVSQERGTGALVAAQLDPTPQPGSTEPGSLIGNVATEADADASSTLKPTGAVTTAGGRPGATEGAEVIRTDPPGILADKDVTQHPTPDVGTASPTAPAYPPATPPTPTGTSGGAPGDVGRLDGGPAVPRTPDAD